MKRRYFLGVMAASPVAAVSAAVPQLGSEEEVEYIGEIQRVKIRPGDVLVVTCDERISWEVARHLREVIQDKFPGHEVMVLGGGLKLAIAGKA
jgi:hypothetical protein